MKEGTLVQISPNIQLDVNGVVSSMLKYAGKLAKIVTNSHDVTLDISVDDWNWSWSKLDLIPIELAVGDTVRIANNIQVGKHFNISEMEKYAGMTSKIIQILDNYDFIQLEIDPRWNWHYNDLTKMDNKYKPGDKVTIVSDFSVNGKGIVSDMVQYAGKKAIVTSNGSNGFYLLDVDGSNWWWHPDLLMDDNIITLDSIIEIGNIVSACVGEDKEFLRNDIVEIRANRSAVKLRDWNKWIPIQQIHADVKVLGDNISDSDHKVYYQSPYLGKIELVDYDPSEKYPLLIKTSDGDEFELTLEGKLFKDSQISVL